MLEPKGPDPVDAALGPSPSMKSRSKSMMNLPKLETLHEGDEGAGSPGLSPPRRKLLRSLSSGTRNDASWSHSLSEDDVPSIVKTELGNMTAHVLLSTTERLREARKALNAGEDSNLAYLLTGVVKRNHLTLEDLLATNARSVANGGQHEFSAVSRKAIANYYDAVSNGLDSLAEAPISHASGLKDRISLVRKMKQNMGRTALMLSGGGAQAMYHLGTIRALIDADVYGDIQVISGTSGGSVTAASCAMFSAEELFEKVCVRTVSTDFGLNGEMKRKNIRWFPRVMDVGAYWLKHRLLVDSQVSHFHVSSYVKFELDPALTLSRHISLSTFSEHVNSILGRPPLRRPLKRLASMYASLSPQVALAEEPCNACCSTIFRPRMLH